jgi:hypothetical protein
MLVTCCAYLMRRFGAAHSFLYGVSERSPSYVLRFVSLLLCFPYFECIQPTMTYSIDLGLRSSRSGALGNTQSPSGGGCSLSSGCVYRKLKSGRSDDEVRRVSRVIS